MAWFAIRLGRLGEICQVSRVLDKSGICFLTPTPRGWEVTRCRSRKEFTG
jgi:hypothetical protein